MYSEPGYMRTKAHCIEADGAAIAICLCTMPANDRSRCSQNTMKANGSYAQTHLMMRSLVERNIFTFW